MNAWPKISIVTPSFNQAAFLEQTLDSVLGQNYPNLEYIVMDGGSTDGSAEIVERYGPRLASWQSRRDAGQADAIVQGFRRATGDILGWVNSDDFYLAGALRHVAERLAPGRAQFLFGNCFHFVEGEARGIPSDVAARHARQRLDLIDYLIQPATFWTRTLWEQVGELDPALHYAFDWDWFIRAQKAGAEFLSTPRYLAAYRIHGGAKSSQGGDPRYREIRSVYARHLPPELLPVIDDCRANYRAIDRWRRRFRRWPGFRSRPAEAWLKRMYGARFAALRAEDLRDVLDMIAPEKEG